MLFIRKWLKGHLALLLLGLSSRDHDLLEGEGLAEVAADIDLAGHESRGWSNLA